MKVIKFPDSKQYKDQEDLLEDIMEVLDKHAGTISVASAAGILDIAKAEVMATSLDYLDE